VWVFVCVGRMCASRDVCICVCLCVYVCVRKYIPLSFHLSLRIRYTRLGSISAYSICTCTPTHKDTKHN
jgi:hypothetical protein